MLDDLAALDATDQARLIAHREVTPQELVDAALARIEALNPTLNAVIWSDPERARAEAADPSPGPFAGVPFLFAGIGATRRGLPSWAGNRLLRELDHRSTDDSPLGRRLAATGLVTVGTTNQPELGTTPTTQPLSCGPTANPWDPIRSPAGSSGGAAAAVAAGLVPLAHANDSGGSTRLPAAWCGLVGLKATRGRVADPGATSRLASELVVSRSVRDTARILDAVHGATPADLFRAPPPAGPFSEEVGRPVGPLRVALLTSGGRHAVDPDCVAGARIVAEVLDEQGHHIEPVGDEVLLGGASAVNGRLWTAQIGRRVDHLGELAGRPLTEDEVEPYNWSAAERGRGLPAHEWLGYVEAQQRWASEVIEWMLDYDLLLTPTAGCPPLPTAELEPPAEEPWRMGATYGRIGVFTLPFSVTGQPAISLPLHWTAEGLPVGVQLVAGTGREDLLLRVAAVLEEAMPWRDRRPGLFAGGR